MPLRILPHIARHRLEIKLGLLSSPAETIPTNHCVLVIIAHLFAGTGLQRQPRGWGDDVTTGVTQFMQKGTFRDNFNTNGGNGGAIANFGDISFSLRAIVRK